MNCPSCATPLACPCSTCLCEPHYAGMARWVRLDDGRIRCPTCNFTEVNEFWCAAQAMDALVVTEMSEMSVNGMGKG